MFELYITNRHLCQGDFLKRIAWLASLKPHGIILREKDLPENEYMALAKSAIAVCAAESVPCILHTFVDVALRLQHPLIHLPMPELRELPSGERRFFTTLGASCHSVEDALEAERLGCTYITAGHIFPTKCKADIPPRGIDFLREVCDSVSIPVYALGGINEENRPLALAAHAAGTAVMSLGMVANY